jgi:hypothetical protein
MKPQGHGPPYLIPLNQSAGRRGGEGVSRRIQQTHWDCLVEEEVIVTNESESTMDVLLVIKESDESTPLPDPGSE